MGKLVKFFDIYKQDKFLHLKFINNLKKIFKNTNFILGKPVQKFENEFSKFCKTKYTVGCGNGTDALYLSLKALNLPKNSEVIVPAMTWISTVSSIVNCGYKPVLADVNLSDSLISIKEIKKKITKKTRVILPVHLYGNVVNVNEIKKIINLKRIYIVEDAAQAHGALHENKKNIGFYSDMTCYSFYPGKNLGSYGDGGAVITNKKKFFNVLTKLRNLGSNKKHSHTLIGINSRLDTIQASLLSLKLKKLKILNKQRKKIAKYYDQLIKNKKIKKITYSKHSVYHQYVILVNDRAKFTKYLKKNNIEYGIHYPIPINKLTCFKKMFSNFKFRNSEIISSKCVSLPIDPNIKFTEIKKVTKIINNY